MLISAFAFGGVPEKAVKKAFAEADIYVSPELLGEYRETPLALEAEGKIDRLQLEALIAGIASFVANAKLVTQRKRLALCRDEKDNMLLECCLAAKAGILITSDKDLTELKGLPFGLTISTPRQFIETENG